MWLCGTYTCLLCSVTYRVVRNEDTVVLKKECLDLYTVKASCRLPVWVLVD